MEYNTGSKEFYMRYLYDKTEKIILEYDSELFEHPHLSTGNKVISARKGDAIGPLHPGHYLIYENTGASEKRIRYLGIAPDHAVILQLSVAAFSADNFDSVAHAKRVPVNYCVAPDQLNDSTFRGFEQDYGDTVYPFFGGAETSLPEERIAERLRQLNAWFQSKGLSQLRGFATDNPTPALFRAMKENGLSILQLLNRQGMPSQPFYACEEDIHRPGVRAPEGEPNVLEMPFATAAINGDDYALVPAHFLRWNRTVESGAYPERFRNFVIDCLRAAEFKRKPFFLSAGFELGRTYGVRSMTKHNRRGMALILDLAKKLPIIFANGRDVAAYYEKFCPASPEIVMTQRDYFVGSRIMNKPVNAGPSICMEMFDYKAVFSHLDPLPSVHHDYIEAATNNPNHADEDRANIRVELNGKNARISVAAPLPRKTPIAFWDARPVRIDKPGVSAYYPPILDDRRSHCVIVLPVGFSGEVHVQLEQLSTPSPAEFNGVGNNLWKVQTIGTHPHRQCYLYPDTPLLAPLTIRFTAPKKCKIDSQERPLGDFQRGETVVLEFGPRRSYYRFYGLLPEEVRPAPDAISAIEFAASEFRAFADHADAELQRIHSKDDARFAAQIPSNETTVHEIDCFGNYPFGELVSATPYDRVVRSANEKLSVLVRGSGISVGNGKSFWIHPHALRISVNGLDTLTGTTVNFYLADAVPRWTPGSFRYRIQIKSGDAAVLPTVSWSCPRGDEENKLQKFSVPREKIVNGSVEITIASEQVAVPDDWFADNCFPALLERLVITEE